MQHSKQDRTMQIHGFSAYWADGAALLGSIATIVGYHGYLRHLTRCRPTAVLSHVAKTARAVWVESMMSDSHSGVLAIQTLRNSTMAATFLASTAVLLMVGILTLSEQSSGVQSHLQVLNLFGGSSPEIWMVKILSIVMLMFFAFFSMTNAIRVFNHVGYMINIRGAPGIETFTPTQVAGELNRGGYYYRLGLRAYYYLVPLVFWLFGPLYMIISAIVLVTVLLPRIDKTPDRFEHKPGAG
jgi:uncharacterized membrane protein